jgi:hypothetical protein
LYEQIKLYDLLGIINISSDSGQGCMMNKHFTTMPLILR